MPGAKPRGRLMGAWGRVKKKSGQKFLVWLPVGSRGGNSPFWANSPGLQLRKCAIVAALREAYPVAFGGVYAREEMEDEREPTRAEVVMGVAEVPKQEAPALPAIGAVVEFGEWRGRPIAGLAPDEKVAAVTFAEEQVAQHPKMAAKAKAKLTDNVAAIRASMAPADSAEVVDAEEVTPESSGAALPLSHPDAEPPEPGSEG